VKDIGIAMALAREAALPLPVSALGEQLWNAALLDAGAGRSVSELIRWVEQRTRTEIAPGAESPG